MRSNVAVGKKLTKIKNAQQYGHWKKIQKSYKYAAMRPLGKKLTKIQNAQQCAHLKKK